MWLCVLLNIDPIPYTKDTNSGANQGQLICYHRGNHIEDGIMRI